jgi:uncharacterized membrane protein (DUF441 family)
MNRKGSVSGICCLSVVSLVLLTGCSRNPSLEISGSFFPAWMLAIFIGLIVTLIAKRIFLATRLDPHLTPHLLVYGALMVSATLLTWLLLYW